MILVPEQVANLRKEIKNQKKNLESYQEYFTEKNSVKMNNTNNVTFRDDMLESNYKKKITEYEDAYELLEYGEYLKERVLDKVNIGTRFTVKYDNEDTLDLTLVDTLSGLSIFDGYISLSSPLGQEVYGKKENDTITYNVGRDKITGVIESIQKDPKSYRDFIRNKPFSNRIGIRGKEEIREAKVMGKEEYNKLLSISLSQRDLLIAELQRISRILKPENKAVLSNRKTAIVKLLKENNLAEPVTDNTIGVGTIFDVILMSEKKNIELNDVEMINRAVSTEVEGEYIEKISTLGSRIYGLREGETFKFRINNEEKFVGTVSNIRNISKKEHDLSKKPKTYEYKRK